ncbi:hypothetical protein [Tropicimonas sp.]|uniref:hypothetical protein n=1 Tax=Tropicimonas sp. TaxID=2067044 RepID=UPI003A83BE23
MPNGFAYLALFAWPVAALLFLRRQPLPVGVAVALVGGLLLLPVKPVLDLPLLPAYDKNLAAILAALLVFWQHDARPAGAYRRAAAGEREYTVLPGWIPANIPIRICLVCLIGGAGVTVMQNSEPLVYGPRVIKGLATYDAMSAILGMIVIVLPYLIGRKFFSTSRSQQQLLVVLSIAAVLYALPALYEIKMSPQLNRMVYGFFPHSWLQHYRGGGWRPIVFQSHGLVLSIFFTMALLASIAAARLDRSGRKARFMAAAGLLFVTLVLSKSLGALAIALIMAPIMLLGSARVQILTAMAVSVLLLTYPAFRSAGAIPVGRIVEVANDINPARAESLLFRLNNEDILLEKAARKPLFGWGDFGRARVFNERGEDISVTDGFWVIHLGNGGWVRYLSILGLLCFPILQLVLLRSSREIGTAAALSLIVAANLVDLVPNAGLTSLGWLLAGSLAGLLERRGVTGTQPGDLQDAGMPARSTLSFRPGRVSEGPAPPARPSLYTPGRGNDPPGRKTPAQPLRSSPFIPRAGRRKGAAQDLLESS